MVCGKIQQILYIAGRIWGRKKSSDLSTIGIDKTDPSLQVDSLSSEPPGKLGEYINSHKGITYGNEN